MRCPVCLSQDTKVNDSRLAEDGFIVKRRRQCQNRRCGFRFSTYEQIEILNLTVIKRNGSREPYLREKMERGLKHSLEKRSYTQEDFKKLVNTIERDIQKAVAGDEITSRFIGELVMKRLRSFDKIAYIRFASVYRAFADVKTFQAELASLNGGSVRNVRAKKPALAGKSRRKADATTRKTKR